MKKPILNRYADLISELFGFPSNEAIFNKTKKREIVDARQLLYYLCSQRKMSDSQIALYLSLEGFDTPRQSVRHGINVFKERLNSDPDYKKIIKKFKDV